MPCDKVHKDLLIRERVRAFARRHACTETQALFAEREALDAYRGHHRSAAFAVSVGIGCLKRSAREQGGAA